MEGISNVSQHVALLHYIVIILVGTYLANFTIFYISIVTFP